jgi:hypothetical protein
LWLVELTVGGKHGGAVIGVVPLQVAAARFARYSPGERWFIDETYVRINGVWRYICDVDQHGQVIDVLPSAPPGRRGGTADLHAGAAHAQGHSARQRVSRVAG